MEELKLEVQVRKELGSRKIRAVKRNNFIPAVVYGGKDKTTAIKIDRKMFEHISRQHKGENIIFHLNVMEGEKKLKDYPAIIKEVQQDPVTDRTLHIDFNRISLTEEIEVKVPLVAKGEPVGVKQDGGSLDHVLWELEIECLPTSIPQSIEVDVSQLKLNESVHVKDLKIPQGIKVKQDPESIVFTVSPPMKEISPEQAAAETAATEPEVIKEKKVEAKPGEAAEKPKAEAKDKEGK